MFRQLAEKKWFVPVLLILMALIAVSSLLGAGKSEVPENDTTEARLEELCNTVKGVSNSKVMITYESISAANIYGSQSAEKIVGIAVVCDGGDNPRAKLELYRLIETLFQLSSTKISVSGRG